MCDCRLGTLSPRDLGFLFPVPSLTQCSPRLSPTTAEMPTRDALNPPSLEEALDERRAEQGGSAHPVRAGVFWAWGHR